MIKFFRFFIAGVIFALFTNNVVGQNYNFYWDKTYGGDSREWNGLISSNSMGEIFIISDSQTDIDGNKTVSLCNNGVVNSDIWLLKIDTAGTILWQKGYGSTSDERLPQLYHLNNASNEMIFGCYSTSGIGCEKTEPNRDTLAPVSADYWLCKLDASGNIIWDKTLGGDNFDDYTKVSALPNGEIIVAGESNSGVNYDKSVPNYSISNDLWVLKLSSTGSILWDKVFGGIGGEFLSGIVSNNDGTFLLAGSTNSDIGNDVSEPTQGNYDYWMIKVDQNGNKLWDKRFGGTGPDKCNYISATSDGGYILCGFTVSPQSGDVSEAPKGFQDYWVVKTDSLGNKLWDKRYGGTDGSFGTWIGENTSGGYWVAGYSNSSTAGDVTEPSYGGSDYWLLNINSQGDKLWDKRFGGTGDEFNASINLLADSTLMVFGYSDSGSSIVKTAPSRGWYDNWLVKFSYTDSTTSINTIGSLPYLTFNTFPNPVNEVLNIELISSIQNSKKFNITISDLLGKNLFSESHTFANSNEHISIPISTFNKGSYVLSIYNEEVNYRKKILIIH